MDDFEYSVDISDRDWKCFFAECEECNLLPPSLAGVDDSGMSDIDDKGSVLAQRAQIINPTQSFSENHHLIDSPLDCDASPVEHCLDNQGTGRLDSVLSGSEEDLHLQSINIFFERLKTLTEPKLSQDRVENNSEAIKEEEKCGDGHQASRSNLPKNFPKSNTPASSEKAVVKEAIEPVDAIRSINTVKKLSFEPAACSDSELKTCKPTEVELFIREEAFAESKVNKVTQGTQHHDLTDTLSSEATLQSFSMEMCRNVDDIKQDGLLTDQVILRKKFGTKEDVNPSQESSPSSSIRRKRKKKKRLSVEAGDGGLAWERQVSVKQSDSEEEQCASRERAVITLSQDPFNLNEPQKNLTYLLTPYSTTHNLPLNLSANEIKNKVSNFVPSRDGPHLPENKLSRGVWPASSTKQTSESPLSQSDGSVMSTIICANETTSLQPCCKLKAEKSGWNKNENQKWEVKAGDHLLFDYVNISDIRFENEQILKYSPTEVKSVSVLPCAESCAPTVEVIQNDKLSAAKSVLAAEAGNSGSKEHMLCQNEADPQEQLENDWHHTNQCSRALENSHLSPSAMVGISSHTPNTKPLPLKTSDGSTCTKFMSDFIDQSPHKSHLAKDLSSLDKQQQTNIEVQTLDISSEKNTKAEGTIETSISLLSTNSSQSETKRFFSEDLKTSPSDSTHVTSYTLDAESLTSLSNENLTDMSASFCSSASELDSGSQEEKKHKEADALSERKSQAESKCDFQGEAENVITASTSVSKAEKMENSVFAMSSFWSEMEKLTINDILGLRKTCKASPPNSLAPVQEGEKTDMLVVTNPGIFTEMAESKPKQATGKTPSSPRSVTWESEPVIMSHGGNIYPVNTMLASVIDTSQPVLTERSQKSLKKISKTISVHNLQAQEFESSSYLYQGEILQTIDDRESEKLGYFTEDSAPKQDTDSYSISLTDIFQYLFGGKRSVPHQSATDNMTTYCTAGNSVPEAYDEFFSDFDTESFFYPLIKAEEKNKDKPVPIFSYSRSTGKNLQFPEAYEYFFASSSSDDSSVDSDEEDKCCPVRVVSRFSRKASSTKLSTDVYEDFCTEKDFKENVFCLKSLSFRNIKFTAPVTQNQNSMSLVPVRQSSRSNLRAGTTLNMLGNQDMMLPDPLLYYLEDRISRQLTQQPFRCEDLQATVSNPGLDAPLLPFKQSDMCLVCIAFASWVLKTANPQVGDAWKAVLLANVSALSAIRYLRKYVKVQAVASDMKLRHPALTYP